MLPPVRAAAGCWVFDHSRRSVLVHGSLLKSPTLDLLATLISRTVPASKFRIPLDINPSFSHSAFQAPPALRSVLSEEGFQLFWAPVPL